MKIAIQGGKASFHDIATREYLQRGDIEFSYCKRFTDVCDLVERGDVDMGVMAIENTIAGSILQNYTNIKDHNLYINGEYKLRIKQNLMALPGQKVTDLKKVKSHYMALNQCKDFLMNYGFELEEAYDTADSAKEIRERIEFGVGAVAGELAAKTYDLEIVAESIETIKLNYTRFYFLEKAKGDPLDVNPEANKATLSFELPHKVGALADILAEVVKHDINLTKIQSVPIIGQPEEYTFYVDCVWQKMSDFQRFMATIRNMIINPYILGVYKNWEIDYDR